MIVGIDTSSALTSVAVVDGTDIVELSHEDARRHAEVIGPLLADLVAGIDVDRVRCVAVGVGPGPYTGLRVGIAAGIALGLAWDVPVHGLCSLDAIAAEQQALQPGTPIVVATDARRSEAYWARYDAAGERVEGPRVSPAVDVAVPFSLPHASWVARCVRTLLDAGARPAAADVPLDAHGADTGASAGALAGAALLLPRPLYLRRPDAVASAR